MYLHDGECVSKDLSEAARYFKMAADQGLSYAKFSYGFCLHTGEGVSKNLSEAAQYFRMAADQAMKMVWSITDSMRGVCLQLFPPARVRSQMASWISPTSRK
jgi:hypothetical protein